MGEDFYNRIGGELNEAQLKAVCYNDGPSVVIAGAGSGKTRVLVYKIACLLESGLRPWNIMALTFTNKAAREMRERIGQLVGAELASGLWMGTFHSIFSRILRTESALLGFSSHFTIYNQDDAHNMVKAIIKEMGLDEKVYKPSSVLSAISRAKNHLVWPEQYKSDSRAMRYDAEAGIPMTSEIYSRYMTRMRLADVMDFDDLLIYTHRLLVSHPEVCRKYADRFDFVLVDEYQDTNYVQSRIVWELAHDKKKVCVVGDDAQSIYSFRGAEIDHILDFQKQYEGAQLFMLEQNYRSTQNIVSAANSLINHNGRQIHKDVFSMKEKGLPILIHAAYSDIEEAEIVVGQIRSLQRKEHMEYDDFAILYRTNAQSRNFEESLRRHGIPYRIYGGLSFYDRKEIRDVTAYCRMVVNPHDEEAFKRIVNCPARGIGKTTVDKVIAEARAAQVSLWDVLADPVGHALTVNKGTLAKLEAFKALIQSLTEDAAHKNAALVVQEVLNKSGLMSEILKDSTPEGMSRQENVKELLNAVQEFVRAKCEEGSPEESGLTDFLHEVSLLSDLDESDNEEQDASHKVVLMTVHSAKGLEFPAVFVVGMEEDLFPSQRVHGSQRGLEEERRLFYVAITRAICHCQISFALSRFRYGKTEMCSPSRFLSDIDPEFVRLDAAAARVLNQGRRHSETNSEDRQYTRREPAVSPHTITNVSNPNPLRSPGFRQFEAPVCPKVPVAQAKARTQSPSLSAPTLTVGQRIEHERFGIGVVTEIEGSGENTKATVEFQHLGTKKLLLRFARFKLLEQ